MISIQTFLSAFNEKGTLLKWLKKLEKNYENAALAYVQVVPVDSSHVKLKFIFADETELLSDSLPIGGGGSGVITRQDIINASGLVNPLSQSGTQLVGTTASSMGIIQTPVRAGENIEIVMDSQGYKIKSKQFVPAPIIQKGQYAVTGCLEESNAIGSYTLSNKCFELRRSSYGVDNQLIVDTFTRPVVFKDSISLTEDTTFTGSFICPFNDTRYLGLRIITRNENKVLQAIGEGIAVYDDMYISNTGWTNDGYKQLMYISSGVSQAVKQFLYSNTVIAMV